MDTSSQDIVSTGATLSNVQHPNGDSLDYEWQLSTIGNIYQINSSGTVGYINSLTDVDTYYVPESVGSAGTTDNDRWVYIVTANQPVGSAFGDSGGGNVGFDREVGEGYGPDDPYFSYVENYSGPLTLYSYYFENGEPSHDWLFFYAANSSGAKYAVAATPQQALADYNNSAATAESLYGSGSPPVPPLPTGQASIWEMNGAKIAGGGAVSPNPGTSWRAIGTGDFNGDGSSDILWQNVNGQASIWDMSGSTLIGGGAVSANPGPSWRAIGTGDFYQFVRSLVNGPAVGDPDILWQNANGQVSIWEMNGTKIVSGGPVSANPGPSWRAVGAGDFNDDGNSDILFQNTNGQASIWEMAGTKIIGGGAVSPNPGPSWRAVGTGDFNHDGHADILWQNTSTGQISIWEMNGNALIGGGAVAANPGTAWQAIGAGDFNKDGFSDILLQNKTTGAVSVWEMNGNSLIGGGPVANPGTSWQAIGAGGGSEILFQNAIQTPA
jgi:hypothetical protein